MRSFKLFALCRLATQSGNLIYEDQNLHFASETNRKVTKLVPGFDFRAVHLPVQDTALPAFRSHFAGFPILINRAPFLPLLPDSNDLAESARHCEALCHFSNPFWSLPDL